MFIQKFYRRKVSEYKHKAKLQNDKLHKVSKQHSRKYLLNETWTRNKSDTESQK